MCVCVSTTFDDDDDDDALAWTLFFFFFQPFQNNKFLGAGDIGGDSGPVIQSYIQRPGCLLSYSTDIICLGVHTVPTEYLLMYSLSIIWLPHSSSSPLLMANHMAILCDLEFKCMWD